LQEGGPEGPHQLQCPLAGVRCPRRLRGVRLPADIRPEQVPPDDRERPERAAERWHRTRRHREREGQCRQLRDQPRIHSLRPPVEQEPGRSLMVPADQREARRAPVLRAFNLAATKSVVTPDSHRIATADACCPQANQQPQNPYDPRLAVMHHSYFSTRLLQTASTSSAELGTSSCYQKRRTDQPASTRRRSVSRSLSTFRRSFSTHHCARTFGRVP